MKIKTSIFLALILTISSTAQSEELDTIFKKVNEYVAAENYSKALKELAWAEKELQKLNSKKIETLLPDTLVGFTGGKAESANVMGMNNLERTYSKDDKKFSVAITGGSAAGAMGGLAALGQLGAMMGNQPGVDTFRLDGRTANLEARNGNASLTVFLKSGSMLRLEDNRSKDEGKLLKEAAKALEISKIDDYLKGN